MSTLTLFRPSAATAPGPPSPRRLPRARRSRIGMIWTDCAVSRSLWWPFSISGSGGCPAAWTCSWPVRLLLRQFAAADRADPGRLAVAVAPPQAAGPAAAARAGGGARRGRDTDHPGAAPDPLGDLRRPEPGQPRVLPELGTGRHRVELPTCRRGGLAAATHLVDVGAGPVLPCLPGPGPRLRRAVAQATGHRDCDRCSSWC